jgi:branched-chain amino acid transport system ATP-binding protein
VTDSNRTAPLLVVENLCAGYGEIEILHGVSLSVNPGETVVVLGPNGHGKTTLARTISGLLPAKSGRIVFGGNVITGMSPDILVSLGIIHVPQGDYLFADMTVLENLLMGAYRSSAWSRRRQKLARVFELFPRLQERQKQLARTLSGGERRMLALARGLMADAQLFIIDEPSLGLAPVVISDVYRWIGEIKSSGLALLLMEESASHVESLSDRLYLLENGRIVREGRALELFRDAAVLQAYLGAEPLQG